MLSTPGRRRFAWFVIGVLAGALTLLALVAIVQTRDLAGTIRASQKDGRALVKEIRGCTTPGKPCSNRSKQNIARAVARINADNRHTVALAASCASRRYGQTTSEIARCINKRLADENRKRRP